MGITNLIKSNYVGYYSGGVMRMQAKTGLNIASTLLVILFTLAPLRSLAVESQISFIHMNDLHANLTAHGELVRHLAEDGTAYTTLETRGGIARISTLVKQLRAANPNAILMNIGDTYHGGVEALYTRGNAIVAPVEALDIDIAVPGNWDFAYGPITTRLRYSSSASPLSSLVNKFLFGSAVEKPSYPVIAGNVRKTLPLLFEDEQLLPATYTMNVGETKIGFIGITSDIVERMSPMLAWGFTFLQGEEAYTELINTHARELRDAGVNLVVVLSELGLHRDHQLANVIDPGVDIFFSAHTHELTPSPLPSKSGAIVVEAGNDAYLGNMVVTLSDGIASDFSWHVLDVDDSLPEDPDMARLVAEARAPFLGEKVNFEYPMPGVELPLTESIDTLSGHVSVDLHRRNVLENPFNNLLADSMRNYYHTDIALTPGFRFDSVIPANSDITLEQLYRYLPVPPVVSTGTISGKNLKAVFETELMRVFSTDAFKHSGGWLMGVSGIDLTLDLSQNEGKRVLAMARSGDMSEILPNDILSVVSCTRPFDDEGVMCSNPGFASVETVPGPDREQWTPMELLRHALENDLTNTRSRVHIHDNSQLPAWPQSPYLQALHSQAAP